MFSLGYIGNDEPEALKGRLLLFEITTAGSSSTSSMYVFLITYIYWQFLYAVIVVLSRVGATAVAVVVV